MKTEERVFYEILKKHDDFVGIPTKGYTILILEGSLSCVSGVEYFIDHDKDTDKKSKPYLIPNSSDDIKGNNLKCYK